jgi:hypothetical protein
MSITNKKVILYVPMSPMPPAGQVSEVLILKVAPLREPTTRFAVAIIFDPEHGEVVDWIAPQRAAVLTEVCNKFSIHTIQAVWIIPRMSSKTGSADKANSTAAAPRSHRRR